MAATIHIPEKLKNIPKNYFKPCRQAGRLETVVYQTYESFSYTSADPLPLKKEALVYLPYSYREDRPYPIVYLSHGGWSDEATTMGRPEQPRAFKHIVDHAIANGDMEPMLIVLLTYNNTSSEDSSDYGLAIDLTSRYHRELVNDLIPAVEGAYSTYAESVRPADLKASRHYRAFSGFSMGSVNTWRTFEHALDYFYYFNPMSGNVSTPPAVFAEAAVSRNLDFLIYAMTGTADFAYAAFKNQVLNLAEQAPEVFKLDSNLFFRERAGAKHDYSAVCDYTYNALSCFWQSHKL
ncbi:alpha/beta hydrolase [Streptococcus sp. H31]|uniref:alpha/beta hydrolase n=1 Tax=Streptococcus huangxiaojuni TaxID=3237239 RepID=UPI0034A2DD7F